MTTLRTSFLFSLSLVLTSAACGSDDDTDAVGSTSTTASVASSGTSSTSSAGGMGTGATGATGAGAGGASSSSSAGGAGGGQGGAAPFALTSTAYTEGQMIPMKYECQNGTNTSVSPPLAWTPGPAGTQSYAVVMRDLDYMNGFLHWVIWDIPASETGLPENVEHAYQPADPAGAKQAPFMGPNIGYYGPCSPNSVNTYQITVYAIPTATLPGLDDTSTKMEAEQAIVGAATANATLSGES